MDSLNIVWHGNYCKYFEVARCELLHKIGYDYADMRNTGYAFPIIELKAKYIAAGISAAHPYSRGAAG
ncbi:MAG: hypothetical protein NVV73_13445, partial [Cellvibrionaceae bacterium]|nr:hypothetical protein [Cellvibrionaceae bacterium]